MTTVVSGSLCLTRPADLGSFHLQLSDQGCRVGSPSKGEIWDLYLQSRLEPLLP